MTESACVLIPALNAARTLPPIVNDALEQVRELIVVDDGSTDGTGQAAADAGAIVLRHEVNRGKGAALKTGFEWAVKNGFDNVITLDADGQHLPAQIPKFIAAREETNADLIIGGRAHLFDGMLPRRRAANRFSAATISWASGTKVPDSQSGYRLYSRKLLESVQLRSNGFAMESEVIVRAGRANLSILTIPIDLGFVDGQSTSHYQPLHDTLRIAAVVLRTYIECLMRRGGGFTRRQV